MTQLALIEGVSSHPHSHGGQRFTEFCRTCGDRKTTCHYPSGTVNVCLKCKKLAIEKFRNGVKANPEKLKHRQALQRAWHDRAKKDPAVRAKILASRKSHYVRHREKILARQRVRMSDPTRKHHKKELSIALRCDRKDKHFFRHKADGWNLGIEGAKALALLWKKQRGRCGLTGLKLNKDAQIDHIVPRSKGGQNVIENLRWTDPRINKMKHSMTDGELKAMCRMVLDWEATNAR
jgi:5-methylcytosine-specific restriction endonuclease McrA